jgi:hypothetical protein
MRSTVTFKNKRKPRMKKQSSVVTSLAFALSLGAGIAFAQTDGLPRGAYDMPYTRYESEDATKGGTAKLEEAPTFDQSQIACEASNQKYVGLASSNDYVEWPVTKPADGVTLRFTMPDKADGSGMDGSLGVYVNGAKVQSVAVSSYHAYQYFPAYDPVETPGGKTFMRFDEVHFKLATKLKAGDTFRIQKDNGDAITYGIDFAELEDVPAALALPANFLSVTAYGAAPDDTIDDMPAFNQCIAAAVAQGKGVYIPAGRFILNDKLTLNVSNLKIQGAGIWYTEIYFSNNTKFSGGIIARATNVELSNFYMNTINRDRMVNGDYRIYKAFMGTYGSGSKIHDIWEEHFECGFWIGGYDPPYPIDMTDKLTIAYVRIRNNYADGVNLCEGTSNCLVEHCSFRNGGDDAMAIWPDKTYATQPCMNDIFRYNTVENNWRAGSAAIFGGYGNEINHCLIKDGVGGSGIRFTNDFPGYTFDNTGALTKIYENTIIACGTSYDLWNQKRGAIELYANTGIFNIRFDNNDIVNAQRDGIQMYGNNIYNLVFNNTTIDGTGKDGTPRDVGKDVYSGFGIYVQAGSQTATFNNLTVLNSASGTFINRNQSFQLIIQNASTPVTGVSISPTTAVSISTGQTAQFTAVIQPPDAINQNVAWTSSSPAVATVDATGKVTGAAVGSATITVTTQDGNKTATKLISVTPAVTIVATGPLAAEGGNTGVFTISTSGASQSITVPYTISGTATAADYAPVLSGSVTLTSAAPSSTITITPVDNNKFDGTRTLTLTLQPGTGYNVGTPASATVSIADNDNPPCTSPVIAYTSTAPVIDQTIDSAWSKAPTGKISNITIGSKSADFSAQWRGMYDATNLYMLVEVVDANKVNHSNANWWEDDAVEIFIDGNNSKGTSYDKVNDFQLGFRWNDTQIHIGSNSVTTTTGIKFAIQNTTTGYNLEAALPWATIGVTPALGSAIGLDIAVDNDNGGTTRDFQATAFATTTTAWSDPSVFGTVYLTSCGPVGTGRSAPLPLTRAKLPAGQMRKITGSTFIFPREFSPFFKSVSVYDLRGRLEVNAVVGKNALDIQKDLGLSSGMHIIKFKALENKTE